MLLEFRNYEIPWNDLISFKLFYFILFHKTKHLNIFSKKPMKFKFFIICLTIVSLALADSLVSSESTESEAPFERIFGFKRVILTIASNEQHLKFSVLMGLHHRSGFLFRLNHKQLNKDTSNFFKDATFLKKNRDAKNEYIAYLDFRLVDTCNFDTEEGGLYLGQNLVFSVKNHEGASEQRIWNIGIAPRLKNKKFCSGMTLISFAKRMKDTCNARHNTLKTQLKSFSDAGDHYYRVTTEIRELDAKLVDLKNKALLSEKEHKDILAHIGKSKIILKLLRKDVSTAAANYLKSKQILRDQLAGSLNKGALVGQISKEATFAKGRYQVALRNLDQVKQRILELIPDAEKLVNRAFFSADDGKHREILEKLRINS